MTPTLSQCSQLIVQPSTSGHKALIPKTMSNVRVGDCCGIVGEDSNGENILHDEEEILQCARIEFDHGDNTQGEQKSIFSSHLCKNTPEFRGEEEIHQNTTTLPASGTRPENGIVLVIVLSFARQIDAELRERDEVGR